jgi:hypothetical protein
MSNSPPPSAVVLPITIVQQSVGAASVGAAKVGLQQATERNGNTTTPNAHNVENGFFGNKTG